MVESRGQCRVLATVLLSGCRVTKTPLDVGGSNGDGTIIIGVNVGEFDRVNWDGAQVKAKERCMAWGYRDAEAFEGIRELMKRRDGLPVLRPHPHREP